MIRSLHDNMDESKSLELLHLHLSCRISKSYITALMQVRIRTLGNAKGMRRMK
jgi:hypothetical protein